MQEQRCACRLCARWAVPWLIQDLRHLKLYRCSTKSRVYRWDCRLTTTPHHWVVWWAPCSERSFQLASWSEHGVISSLLLVFSEKRHDISFIWQCQILPVRVPGTARTGRLPWEFQSLRKQLCFLQRSPLTSCASTWPTEVACLPSDRWYRLNDPSEVAVKASTDVVVPCVQAFRVTWWFEWNATPCRKGHVVLYLVIFGIGTSPRARLPPWSRTQCWPRVCLLTSFSFQGH